MNLHRYLPAFALLFCLASCSKNNNTDMGVQKSVLIGRWSLQKQNYTQYINGTQAVNATYLAADTSDSFLQLNADGTFTSISNRRVSYQGNTAWASSAVDGIYTLDENTFYINPTMTGLAAYTMGFIGPNNTTAPSIALNSHTVKLIQANPGNLQIHTEDDFIITQNNATRSVKNSSDFYYSR